MVHKLKSQLWTKNKNPIAICKPLKKIIEPTNQPSPIALFKKMAELVIIDVALLFVFQWKRSTSLWELTFILFCRI